MPENVPRDYKLDEDNKADRLSRRYFGRRDPAIRGAIDRVREGDSQEKELMDFIRQFLEYETPQEVIDTRMGQLGRSLSARQAQDIRAFRAADFGRTGGRMGTARGTQEIGGQYALARAAGQAQILNAAFEREMRAKLAGLQAYIQKYGIDKNAQLALQQLRQQREQAEAGMWGDILGSAALAAFLL